MLEPAARALGVGRGNLHQMLKRYARLEAVRQEQRQVMGDFESKTFESMSEKALAFDPVLSFDSVQRPRLRPAQGNGAQHGRGGEHDGDPERDDQAIRAGNSLTMTSS